MCASHAFVRDTVLDPFLGSGTTSIAAMKCGRNSVGVDIEPAYFAMAKRRAEEEAGGLFSAIELCFERCDHRSKPTKVLTA